MNPNELLRIVDSLHRDKNIDPEIVFQAIESALMSAARKQYGDESDIQVHIDREDGSISASRDGGMLDPDIIGRIGAQTAKQVIIQKIREAERDSLLEEYQEQIGQMVSGVVQRSEGGATTVSLKGVEAILPRSEQIPGESHHPNERIRAIIYEVKPQGNRVKVVLSRTHTQLVRRLFEQEIPEIADGVITINSISREPGYRSKVAVSSADQRIDCVGACVGVRGNRIKNIVDELAGERIDIVRYSEDPNTLIPNALQPAEVEQVLLCDMIGRAIVLVREDQLSLAIGRRGQNVRLGSKLCGWDIEIMTSDELEEQIERAVEGFGELDGMTEELAQRLVEQGYLSYDDLSVIEPDALQEMGDLSPEQVEHIVEQADRKSEEAERAAVEQRRRQKEREMLEKVQAEKQLAEDAVAEQQAAEQQAAEQQAVEQQAAEQQAEPGEPEPQEPAEAGSQQEPEVEEAAGESTSESEKLEPAAEEDASQADPSAERKIESEEQTVMGEAERGNESSEADVSPPEDRGSDQPQPDTEKSKT